MGEGWVLRRSISVTRIRAQRLRGFLGVGDGDEDSGLSKTYEERCVIGLFICRLLHLEAIFSST
ncbi:hypothetical protein SUGI_0234120 [Cryptomeria japonica]|nr:hypothetical protein SUGI_0234120 [Cryptomeria japonica]